MKHWLFNILATLSTLLLEFAILLWLISYVGMIHIRIPTRPYKSVTSSMGGITFCWVTTPPSLAPSPPASTWIFAGFSYSENCPIFLWGNFYTSRLIAINNAASTGNALEIPYWSLALIFLLLPLLWLRAYRSILRSHFLHICPTCGYDLRASKGRCPECGMAIPLMNEGKG